MSRIKDFLGRFIPLPAKSAHNLHYDLWAKLSSIEKDLNNRLDKFEAQIKDVQKLQTDSIINETKSLIKNHEMLVLRLDNIKKQQDGIQKHQSESLADFAQQLGESNAKISTRIDQIDKRMHSQNYKFSTFEKFKNYDYYKNLKPANYRRALEDWYESRTEKKLDLDNPQTLSEKIQWLKLHDSTPLKTQLTDKFEVKSWVSEQIGDQYVIPLLGVWDNFEEIDFGNLPNQFVLKCTHGASWNLIVWDKSAINLLETKLLFDSWLATNFAFYAGLELHYRDIKPRIIAEAYLDSIDGTSNYDYKVWCFNGTPEFIVTQSNEGDRAVPVKSAYYDVNWNRIPFKIRGRMEETTQFVKPERLSEMLELAKMLCKDFCLVRVDFYITKDGNIKFGELTFTPGTGVTTWEPPEYDMILGQKLKLPRIGVSGLNG